MSLDTDYTLIENFEEVIYETVDGQVRMRPRSQAIIFGTMPLGIGSITEENAAEFYARLAYYELLFGAFVTRWDGETSIPEPITPEDVRLHIGLRTNVFPKETERRWLVRMGQMKLRELEHESSKARETAQ